jgi:hypothetical protein
MRNSNREVLRLGKILMPTDGEKEVFSVGLSEKMRYFSFAPIKNVVFMCLFLAMECAIG